MSNTITYESLLNRALERVSTGIDTSEGSFLFDAIAPCVAELYEAYLYIDELEKRVFADTAYGEYLDRRCAEHGIYRKEATYAIRKGYFDNEVPIGSRWEKECPKYYVKNEDAWKKLKQDVLDAMSKDEELENAVKVLQEKGIISNPDVWIKG